MTHNTAIRRLAIIGGLGQLASADLNRKLANTLDERGIAELYNVTLVQRRYDRGIETGAEKARIGGRKLYLYDTMEALDQCQADGILLPCFISHTFLSELQAELKVPVLNMMAALAFHLGDKGGGRSLGILCTSYVQDSKMFEQYFSNEELFYPSDTTQNTCINPAMYGDDGLLAGYSDSIVLERLHQACMDLLAQGAEVIIPGASEIAAMAGALRQLGLPVVDSHQAYVDYTLVHQNIQRIPAFKVGIIGGIGPAATVDFMRKIIDNTTAKCDQEHIRLLVDHNPQIPDRTANLIGVGIDPTLALYSACKRLEANGAALITMPCNTAHAYVKRLQSGLSIPIINMLSETVQHIASHCSTHTKVGLLATTGTISSGVYHEAARGSAFELLVPDEQHQALVMDAIYGEQGVKAGHVDGSCLEMVIRAMAHLAERGATVVILGCTELPLLFPEQSTCDAESHVVALVDPTTILARRCVALSMEANNMADFIARTPIA